MGGPVDISALKRRLLSGGAWAVGGKALTVILGLLVNVLLARLLSPQDLGSYFLAVSVVSFGTLLGALGLNQVAVRFVAESMSSKLFGRARRVVRLVLSLGVLGSLSVCFLYLSVGQLIGKSFFGSSALAALSGLIACWMAVMTLQILLAEVFRGFNDIRLATLFGGFSTAAMLTVCLSLIWLFEERTTLATVVTLAFGAGLSGVLLSVWLLCKKIATLPQQGAEGGISYGALMRAAWPLLVTNLTLFAITQADVWIVGAFRSQEDVALYGAAARIVIVLSMPLMIVNLVVPPLIAELYSQGRRTELGRVLRTTATVAGIPSFLLLVILVLLGGPILGLIYGDYYRAGATVLALLSLGQLVNVWVGSCGITLVMTGHQMLMMMITLICALITVAVGLLLVDTYGTTGVAAAAASGLALQNLCMWLGARIVVGIWTHVRLLHILKGDTTEESS